MKTQITSQQVTIQNPAVITSKDLPALIHAIANCSTSNYKFSCIRVISTFETLLSASSNTRSVVYNLLEGFIDGVLSTICNPSDDEERLVASLERVKEIASRFTFDNFYSAVLASPPPDSAVLENAVVETAQGATLSTTVEYIPQTDFSCLTTEELKAECSSLLKRIDLREQSEQCQPSVEYVPVQQLLHHETDLPYHMLEEVIAIMRERGLLLSIPSSTTQTSAVYLGSNRSNKRAKIYDKSEQHFACEELTHGFFPTSAELAIYKQLQALDTSPTFTLAAIKKQWGL